MTGRIEEVTAAEGTPGHGRKKLLGSTVLLLTLGLLQAGASCGGGSGGSGSEAVPVTPSGPTIPPPADARGCERNPVSPEGTEVDVVRVFEGLSKPLLVVTPPGDLERIFVVEQNGRVLVARDGVLLSDAFLEIQDRISTGGERGLLGLAFHPAYAENGRFFVSYTNPDGESHIAEYSVSQDDPDRAVRDSEQIRMVVDQPFGNHNGGHIVFGADGYLYIGFGDGGSGGDPENNGQDLGTLLGSMLRIDVDTPQDYAIPPGNPFVDVEGARPETWSYGLRNPWRYSFDAETGDLWIGDVGQNRREEISVGLASRAGGENFGWNPFEADECFLEDADCAALPDAVPPVVAYGRDQGCSVTGGVVYRGRQMPALRGTYFYGDFCTGMVRSFRPDPRGLPTEARDHSDRFRNAGVGSVSSFGEDACGELYIVDHSGEVYRLVPR